MQLILFGTGQIAEQYTARLPALGYDVDFYVDNNASKQGTTFMGRPVRSPKALLTNTEASVLIATSKVNAAAIRAQLAEMNLDKRLTNLHELVRLAINDKLAMCAETLPTPDKIQSHKRTIIFDLFSVAPWGGREQWSFNLARGLRSRGHNVLLLASPFLNVPDDCASFTRTLDLTSTSDINALIDTLVRAMPFVYISQYWDSLVPLHVAAALRKRYGEAVKIIGVLHCDCEYTYSSTYGLTIGVCANRWLCVSPKIATTFIYSYPDIDARRVFSRDNFTDYDPDLQRGYSVDGEPLRLCWVCRIVIEQKRADVLPLVVNRLRELRVNFTLDIAGDGELYDALRDFVAKYNLANVVRLHGLLGKAEVSDVYRRSDVFLSFSDYEGSSMSQLEAMAHGCVPVLTAVSGTEGIVVDGVNGYVRPVGDFYGLIERICYLAEHRELLPLMGQRSRDVIRDKCTIDDYLDYMENTVLNFDEEDRS